MFMLMNIISRTREEDSLGIPKQMGVPLHHDMIKSNATLICGRFLTSNRVSMFGSSSWQPLILSLIYHINVISLCIINLPAFQFDAKFFVFVFYVNSMKHVYLMHGIETWFLMLLDHVILWWQIFRTILTHGR